MDLGVDFKYLFIDVSIILDEEKSSGGNGLVKVRLELLIGFSNLELSRASPFNFQIYITY